MYALAIKYLLNVCPQEISTRLSFGTVQTKTGIIRTTEISMSDQSFSALTSYELNGSYIANIGPVTNKQDSDQPAFQRCQYFVWSSIYRFWAVSADTQSIRVVSSLVHSVW